MAGNRQLSSDELTRLFAPLFAEVRGRIEAVGEGDEGLCWALRRKLAKELTYLERGKPMHRRALKAVKRAEQAGKCAKCGKELAAHGPVLDRFDAMLGYTQENTRLLCHDCDWAIQTERRFK